MPVASGANLTRIYRGDDGGALYLPKLGNTVYGFGERKTPEAFRKFLAADIQKWAKVVKAIQLPPQ